jgi:DNA helicase-2/ATP-dependent DNA helicase PcrA
VADDTAQASYVVERVLENREAGITLKSQAVLFRASHHSASLEVELTRRNIPFVKFGGLKFLEAAHVKDILAVLRWAQNIGDRVAGFRVAQLLPGIGPSWAARLLDSMADGPDPMEILSVFKPPPAAAEHWPDFEAMVGLLRRNAAGWPSELDLVCRWYAPHLERIYEDSAALREADLIQLAQIASTYSSRERFLTELTLDPPDADTEVSKGASIREQRFDETEIGEAKMLTLREVLPEQHRPL